MNKKTALQIQGGFLLEIMKNDCPILS